MVDFAPQGRSRVRLAQSLLLDVVGADHQKHDVGRILRHQLRNQRRQFVGPLIRRALMVSIGKRTWPVLMAADEVDLHAVLNELAPEWSAIAVVAGALTSRRDRVPERHDPRRI